VKGDVNNKAFLISFHINRQESLAIE